VPDLDMTSPIQFKPPTRVCPQCKRDVHIRRNKCECGFAWSIRRKKKQKPPLILRKFRAVQQLTDAARVLGTETARQIINEMD
jgi:hypothetical protein